MGNVQGGHDGDNAEAPTPDWGKWRRFDAAPLWQFVALSCNLDPGNASVRWFAQKHFSEPDADLDPAYDFDYAQYLNTVSHKRRKEFLDRLDMAASHVRSRNLETSSGSVHGQVRLAVFAHWAQSVDLKLPEEFPAAQAPAEAQPSSDARPLSTKERTNLLVIIYALAKKAKIDITHPTTAAKAIIGLLDGEGAKIGIRTVEEYLKEIPDALERKGF